MADFDVAVGIGVNQINSASVEVHRIAYPRVFTGSRDITIPVLEFDVTVSWDVKEPVHVDLPTDPANADLKVTLPFAEVAVTAPQSLTPLRFTSDLECEINVSDAGAVTLNPKEVAVSSADIGTPLQDIINKLLQPAALRVFAPSLPQIQLPPLDVEGVSVSPPKAATLGQYLVGVATLAAKGPSQQPSAGDAWPADKDLFVLLSEDALTAAASVALNTINGQLTESGDETPVDVDVNVGPVDIVLAKLKFDWSYSVTLANPQIDVVGEALHITFSVSDADIRAGGKLSSDLFPDISFHLGFDISVDPGLGCTATFEIDRNNTLIATVNTIDSFTVNLTPTGNLPERLIGEPIAKIIEAISGPLTAAIHQWLRNITFEVYQIQDMTLTEQDVSVSIHPSDLEISSFDDMLALTGTIDIIRA